MRSYMLIASCAFAAGCFTGAGDKTETGPTIQVRITPEVGSQVTNTTTNPQIRLDTTSMTYAFELSVGVRKGHLDSDDEFRDLEVESIPYELGLDGHTFPATPLEPEPGGLTWKLNEQIAIPMSFASQSFTVHAQAVDENGLRSNVVDLSVLLAP